MDGRGEARPVLLLMVPTDGALYSQYKTHQGHYTGKSRSGMALHTESSPDAGCTEMELYCVHGKLEVCHQRVSGLTLSPPILLMLYNLPYWSNPPFLISDIRAIWRSGLSARAPECQKLKTVG